ncbi:hypothetical protein CPAR01_06911 [Colletotrichum paranaense]|uniref:Uncharacterized protein n=1 Tax=Colletotrichum paranaense TaxID=1914294 RepID=A0ABQ9SPC2_9PEZI|nr:uncharacterized protein CPAR01_06911 [Colletotrichum paranaense]KAK1540922.1 hypothetical protein CPAR01_06911 [Colletotrichum paranaense]
MAEMRACLNAVYSKYRTRPSPDMRSSMEMDDQVLTSRPRDLCYRTQFVPWDLEAWFSRVPSSHAVEDHWHLLLGNRAGTGIEA